LDDNIFTKSFLKNIDFEYPSKIIDSASLECNARDFLDTHLYTDLMRKLKPALDNAGIEIPYPHRVINSKNLV